MLTHCSLDTGLSGNSVVKKLIYVIAWACLEDMLHVHRWRQLTAPIAAARVPYGLALGNHDAEADLMRVEIVSLDMQVHSRFP